MAKKKLALAGAGWHTNKLYQTLCSLHKTDARQLLKFLRSPYFNQSKTLVRLCEILFDAIDRDKTSSINSGLGTKFLQENPMTTPIFKSTAQIYSRYLVEDFMAVEAVSNDPVRDSQPA